MEHAHETALWKAIGDIERDLGEVSSSLADRRLGRWALLIIIFLAGWFASYRWGLNDGLDLDRRLRTDAAEALQSQETLKNLERDVRLPPAFPPASDDCKRGI